MIVETIRVKRDGPKGYHIINKADFDPSVHEIYQADPLDHDGDGKKGGSRKRAAKVNAGDEIDGDLA